MSQWGGWFPRKTPAGLAEWCARAVGSYTPARLLAALPAPIVSLHTANFARKGLVVECNKGCVVRRWGHVWLVELLALRVVISILSVSQGKSISAVTMAFEFVQS